MIWKNLFRTEKSICYRQMADVGIDTIKLDNLKLQDTNFFLKK